MKNKVDDYKQKSENEQLKRGFERFYKYTQNPAEKYFISSNEDVVRYKYLKILTLILFLNLTPEGKVTI
jgi:hypothetical protein